MSFKSIAAGPILISACVLLGACDSNKNKVDFPLNEAGVKTLNPKISAVNVASQVDGTSKRIEIQFSADPVIGGMAEWNSLAQDSHQIFQRLLTKPEVTRIFIKVVAPASKNLDWARISVDRESLPNNWQELTYLEFFAQTAPMPGTLQSWTWICDFYKSYQSAQPATGLPRNCKP